MLFLTYDYEYGRDGLGAQYIRIISMIVTADFYNIKYVHTKLRNIEHLDGTGITIDDIEDYFQIINHFDNVDNYSYDHIIREYTPSVELFNTLLERSKTENILLSLNIPFNISRQVGVYDAMNEYANKEVIIKNKEFIDKNKKFLKSILKQRPLSFFDKNNNNNNDAITKNIALHIRRGDIIGNERYRDVDTKKIIDEINQKYENCNIYIFTEIDDKNKDEFNDLNYKNVFVFANENIIDTFNHMINADIFMFGVNDSCFSGLASFYNNNSIAPDFNINDEIIFGDNSSRNEGFSGNKFSNYDNDFYLYNYILYFCICVFIFVIIFVTFFFIYKLVNRNGKNFTKFIRAAVKK